MDIATPNLHVMHHHYNSTENLFKTVTMYAEDEWENVSDDVVKAKSWYGSQIVFPLYLRVLQ